MSDDNRICVICDGGPGNQSACSCGFQKWEKEYEATLIKVARGRKDALGGDRVIHKYDVGFRLRRVMMPAGADIVHFAVQNGTLRIWAVVEPTSGMEDRILGVVGTGHAFPARARHVATTIDGAFVWHLVEQTS